MKMVVSQQLSIVQLVFARHVTQSSRSHLLTSPRDHGKTKSTDAEEEKIRTAIYLRGVCLTTVGQSDGIGRGRGACKEKPRQLEGWTFVICLGARNLLIIRNSEPPLTQRRLTSCRISCSSQESLELIERDRRSVPWRLRLRWNSVRGEARSHVRQPQRKKVVFGKQGCLENWAGYSHCRNRVQIRIFQLLPRPDGGAHGEQAHQCYGAPPESTPVRS